ncbi:MAG TPA: response regulator [Puia sp.]
MKRLSLLFFIAGIITMVLLTRSILWLAAGVVGCMIFLLYRIYASRIFSVQMRTSALEKEVDELHEQLDIYIRKEQKLSKAADQATAAKKRVMAAMSHEIRTPMNGVMGMASLLAETHLDGQQREFVTGIQSCGEQLIAVVNHILVDDMLNISKATESSKLLVNDDFDLRSCIEEVLDMFAGAVGDAGPDLLYHIDSNIPGQLHGDAGRLRQILINLVENAVKATSHGEIYIGVSLLRKEDTKMELGFEVRDTGTGITADKIERIFQGLTETAASDAIPDDEEDEPTGLGLIICRRLVEMMNGWIEVRSEPGKGCTFSFCIQLGLGRKPLRNSLHPGMASLQGKNILLVDDNSLALSLLAGQLRQWKATPVTVSTGKLALDALSSGSAFDLVIAEAGLTGPDGEPLTASLKKQSPRTPVILTTRQGNNPPDTETSAGLLPKPVRQHQLRDLLLHLFYSSSGEQRDKARGTEKLQAHFAERHPLRMLIAEDNPINQKIVMKMLGKLGYHPEMTANGKEVLEEVSNNRYDLVFMDVQMPEMDGLEATRMIRLCLEVQPVIIAMTANAMQGDRDSCLQAGMDDYISKPIELEDLLAQLEKWSAVINGGRKLSDQDSKG